MTRSFETRRRRREDVTRRAQEGRLNTRHCRVVGCGRLTTSATGKGLNSKFCRPHSEHYERHGSYYKKSYPATVLRPHLRQALKWLRANRHEQGVRLAIAGVEALYAGAGPHVAGTGLAGLSPQERARAAFARLRKAEVKPERVLAAWMAVDTAIKADPQADTRAEFRRVQAAKAVHRLASGYHRRWETATAHGQPLITELHKYPASRGRVLRHIGAQLERAAEPLAA